MSTPHPPAGVSAPVTYPLPTDTAHVHIDPRQYEIFNIDLGEGIVVRKAVIGFLLFGGWAVLLGALFGVSLFGQYGPVTYVLPPGLITLLAFRDDTGGRPLYVQVTDWVRSRFRRRDLVPTVHPTTTAPIRTAIRLRVVDTPRMKGTAS